jgi:hypothetical protein
MLIRTVIYTCFRLEYGESGVEAPAVLRVVVQTLLDVSKGPTYFIQSGQSKTKNSTLNTQALRASETSETTSLAIASHRRMPAPSETPLSHMQTVLCLMNVTLRSDETRAGDACYDASNSGGPGLDCGYDTRRPELYKANSCWPCYCFALNNSLMTAARCRNM